MRVRVTSIVPAGIVLAGTLVGCGGGGSDGGGGVAVVPGGPAPGPTASPSPTSPVYARFAELGGDQLFRTACATLELNGSPPFPRQPALDFGDGPVIRYTAATDRYAIDGDGVSVTFGPEDRNPAAPATARSYLKRVDGIPQVFSTGQPVSGGVGLDYARGMTLQAPRQGFGTVYYCTFGVPTLLTDRPPAAFTYARAGVNGIAYVVGQGGALRPYALAASTVTARVDPAAGQVTVTIRLIGQSVGPDGAATATTPLGSYAGTATIDWARGSYRGTLTSDDRDAQFATFAGWFHGPQAREAAFSLALIAVDPATGTRLSVVANGNGAQ